MTLEKWDIPIDVQMLSLNKKLNKIPGASI